MLARMDPELDLDVRAYARLAARLATAGDERDTMLAERGLDDDAWDVLEDAWSERMERADLDYGDADGVPPLVADYANAFSQAQMEALAGADLMSLKQYADITKSLQRGRDMPQVFVRHGTSLEAYLLAHSHWSIKLATDPDVSHAFEQLLNC
jgi:hypothetical protein